MAEILNPAAPHHLPVFVTGPGETDVLMVVTGLFLLAAVVGLGVLYLRLHALPEQIAHRGQKLQFQIVAVLALIALFTHNHIFWVAGLLLALVPLPDLTTPLGSIAGSLEKLAAAAGSEAARRPAVEPATEPAAAPPAAPPPSQAQASPHGEQQED